MPVPVTTKGLATMMRFSPSFLRRATQFTLAALLAATTAAMADSSITDGYFKGPNPESVGQRYGLFDKSTHFVTIQSGITAFQAMIGGSLQAASGIGLPPLAIALLQDLPLKAVYVEYNYKQSLIVSPKIASPKDLVGKTIAVTTGTTADKALSDYLAKEKIDPHAVRIVNMTAPDMIGAFKRGSIDAAYIWDPARNALLASGGREIDVTEPIAVIVASDSAIAHDRHGVQQFVCDVAKSNAYIASHREDALTAFTELLGGDRKEAELVTRVRHFYTPEENAGYMASGAAKLAAELESSVRWANSKSTTMAKELPDPHKIIDPSFATYVAQHKCG